MVDTNVILDLFLAREPHVAEARRLFEMIHAKEMTVFVTANSITDIYYIISKRTGDGFARNTVKQILETFGIIAVDGGDCIRALNLPITDFEDALVVACADKEDIDYIVSNDSAFSQIDPTYATVVSPCDFLNRSI